MLATDRVACYWKVNFERLFWLHRNSSPHHPRSFIQDVVAVAGSLAREDDQVCRALAWSSGNMRQHVFTGDCDSWIDPFLLVPWRVVQVVRKHGPESSGERGPNPSYQPLGTVRKMFDECRFDIREEGETRDFGPPGWISFVPESDPSLEGFDDRPIDGPTEVRENLIR